MLKINCYILDITCSLILNLQKHNGASDEIIMLLDTNTIKCESADSPEMFLHPRSKDFSAFMRVKYEASLQNNYNNFKTLHTFDRNYASREELSTLKTFSQFSMSSFLLVGSFKMASTLSIMGSQTTDDATLPAGEEASEYTDWEYGD